MHHGSTESCAKILSRGTEHKVQYSEQSDLRYYGEVKLRTRNQEEQQEYYGSPMLGKVYHLLAFGIEVRHHCAYRHAKQKRREVEK